MITKGRKGRTGIRAALLGCVWLFLCLCGARATAQLPLDIKAQFGSIDIRETACWEGDDSTWFLLARTPDGVNRLIGYTLENGTWVQKFQSATALPQGDGRVRLQMTNQMQDFTRNITVTGPILMILQYGTGEKESSILAHYEFLRSDEGVWELLHAFFQEEQVHVDFDENSVTFSTPISQDHSMIRTVEEPVERDLRRVDFTTIPRTPEQIVRTETE